MNLINDLGNELAHAVLVEKKHREKISSKDVLPLISRIADALEPSSNEEDSIKSIETSAKAAGNSEH